MVFQCDTNLSSNTSSIKSRSCVTLAKLLNFYDSYFLICKIEQYCLQKGESVKKVTYFKYQIEYPKMPNPCCMPRVLVPFLPSFRIPFARRPRGTVSLFTSQRGGKGAEGRGHSPGLRMSNPNSQGKKYPSFQNWGRICRNT